MSASVTAGKMQVAFVDLKAQWANIGAEARLAMNRVLDNADFILSADVSEFEKNFAAFTGTKHCVGVGSGTDAIMLALEACGVGQGDEVLVPTNTYVATVAAICHRGAKPVFVEIDEGTYFMNLPDAMAKCSARTKAVTPVHLYGQAMDLKPLMLWAKDKGLRVVEDACQAHGALMPDGLTAGARGDVGCFSFYPGKNLGCYGDGGAIVTNDAGIAKTIEELRNQGQREKYIHTHKGYNSRLDSLQAAVLNVKLRYLPVWNDSRRAWARYYDEALAGIDGLALPHWNSQSVSGKGHVFHLYVVRAGRRESLLRHLRENGVAAQIHYPIPVHLQEGYSDLGFGRGDLPVAEKVAGEILSLPIYPELTEEKAAHVAACVREFFLK